MMKQKKKKLNIKKTKNLFAFLLLFLGNLVLYGQCGVNAGGNATICGTSYTLQGTVLGTPDGTPTWTIVSKPAGAPDPVFSNPNIMTPNVTGMTFPGNYVFQVANTCSGTPVTSQVTILAPGANTGYSAGPDITGIPATTGVATLSATVPAGYTPSWTYYNIYSNEINGAIVTTNATMSGTTTATPTLTLTNKANHTIDPSYRVVLRITSVNNPSCWYEDDAIVRFTPNPNMLWNPMSTTCVSQPVGGGTFYYDPTGASPRLATTTANSSGNPAFGTTVTMTPVSQPPGGNIQYSRMENGRLYFTGITATGDYVFDLTISNTLGTFTNRLTYRFNGFQPSALTFLDPAHPAQTEFYSSANTGGAVYCNMVGSTAPITFYYKINAADPPTISDVITNGTAVPPGGSPTFVQSGAGTANRSVTLTPPSGGWRAGTYKIAVTLDNGCTRQHIFYAHISDNARPAVNVDNITICYPGSGVVSATVPLPASYIAPASNPSYLQQYGGRYDFTWVSGPTGAATPVYEVATNRSLTSASTIISNLDRAGEYVFRIKAVGIGSGKILTDEFACAGTSMEDTFSIFVTAQVGANAGSAQNISCITTATLNGNNPGTQGSTGLWTIASKPAGAPDPVITNPAQYNSGITNLVNTGAYTFDWTISTGTCTSSSQTTINVTAAPSAVTVTPATQTVAYNAAPTNLTGSATGATSYQWYSNTANNNTGGTLISGATSTTYTPPTNVAGTRYYYIVASNAGCNTPSATVEVIVTPCAAVSTAPTVNSAVSNNCPTTTVNLNTQAHTGAVPANATLLWFTDAAHTTAVATPTAVGVGTYYAFYYSGSSTCYSPASNAVNVTINGCSACTAAVPQQVSLTSITVAAAPTGSVLQWHNSATPSASTLLSSTTVNATSTPTNYWAYYYDSVGNCYSPGSKATVVGNTCCNYPTVDLAALSHSAVPAGTQLVWYSTSGRLPGSKVNNPTAVGSGLYWPFFYDPALNCYSQAGTPVLVGVDSQCNTACYKPGATTGGATLDTKLGISSLGRAGATDADNWPMTRKGGWIALESKTKGFVPNRVAFSGGNPVGIAAANFVEGMMVYDTTNKCLKVYTLKAGDPAMAWHCVTTQACPD